MSATCAASCRRPVRTRPSTPSAAWATSSGSSDALVTLRTRIAAAAGVAVAVAVIAATVVVYAALRSELRGGVEAALRERATTIARAPGPELLAGAGPGPYAG